MNERSGSQSLSHYLYASNVCSLLVLLIGILVIVGWIFDISILKNVFPNYISMKPNTAIGFICTGTSLLLLQKSQRPFFFTLLARSLTIIVLIIGVFTFIEHVTGSDFRIDELFFTDLGPLLFYPAGRMAPLTSIIFVITSMALLLIDAKWYRTYQVLALVIGICGLMILFGFGQHSNKAYQMEPYVYAAIHTAIAFILIAISLLFMRPTHGMMTVIISHTNSGKVVRRIIPAIILIFILLSYLRILGQQYNLFETETGTTFLITAILFIGIMLSILAANKHKQAEDQLLKLNTSLSLALEVGEIGIWEWNFRTKKLMFDKKLNSIFGLNENNRLESNNFAKLLDIIHLEDRARVENELNQALNKKASFVTEFRIIKPTKEVCFIQSRGEVLLNEDLQTSIIAINRDITKQKLYEESIKVALSKTEESNKNLQQFVYIASHDLQEPLRMITSYLQLFERRYKDKIDGDANDFIKFAVDGANRMQLLITDLLDFSRVASKAKAFAPTDCNKIMLNVLDNLQILIKERNAKVVIEKLPVVSADDIQLSQVFQNLINNAIKFCDDTPKIHVAVKDEENRWIFSISDNGIGISPENLKQLFVMFKRFNSTGKYPGTGIGLAICKRIIDRHGGKIWAESDLEKGSTFYFTINK